MNAPREGTPMAPIDTHVHVWDPRRLRYPWLDGLDALDAPFLPGDYPGRAETRAVFVQADCIPEQALDEARWVAGQDWPALAGIVAGADLRSPDLAAHLDALGDIDIVVGVRHLLQGEPVERLSEPSLQRGLAVLAERDLTFDACVQHPQLAALNDLLRTVPGLRVVLDHVGKPPVDDGIASEDGRRWSDGMLRLAELPQAHVKLSGLPPETSDRPAFEKHAPDFLAFAIEAFGPERCMVGSDWPVSARMGVGESPQEWSDRVRAATRLDGPEWDLVSGRTGARFYRLSDSA